MNVPFSRLGLLLGLLVLGELAVGLFHAPARWDAGYYLPLAHHVADGLVPYRDFPSHYPPGGSYLLALLGPEGTRSIEACRLVLYGAHLLQALLLVLVLRTLGHSRTHAFLLGVLLLTWVVAADGLHVKLEPFMGCYLMLGLLVVLRWPSVPGAFLGGLALGAALMVKQLSLLLIPALVVLVLTQSRTSRRNSWWRLACLLAAGALPFALFVLPHQLPFFGTLHQVMTYGADAGSFSAGGPGPLMLALTTGPVAMTVLPAMLVLGLACLLLDRSALNLGLLLGLLGASVPLLLRPSTHYVQVIAPWALLLVAQLTRHLAGRWTTRPEAAPMLSLLCCAPLATCLLLNLTGAYQQLLDRPLEVQKQAAAAILAALPGQEDVLILGGPWLHALTDLTPPGRYYKFASGLPEIQARADSASHVVAFTSSPDTRRTGAWLLGAGFQEHARVEGPEGAVLYTRSKAPR